MAGSRQPAEAKTQSASRPPIPSRPADSPALDRARAAAPDSRAAAARPATPAERRLMQRVITGCGGAISQACVLSPVPAAFLAALTANESGGDSTAARFEPAVYKHLAAVVRGERPAFGGITPSALDSEIAHLLHPKAASFHEHFAQLIGSAPTGAEAPRAVPSLPAEDELLRELATSWGYTQIMGYHLIGRDETIGNLLQPDFHFHLALELLAAFAHEYALDLGADFPQLFTCWNTGRPDGQTFDPKYVANGIRRMEIYRRLEATAPGSAIE